MAMHDRKRRQSERGFVIHLYAFMMLFIIIPMVGLALDAGIVYFIKSKLQTACDGAALGAARSLSRGQDIPSQKTSAEDTARRYFHANFPNNWMGVNPVPDPAVTWPTAPLATAIVNVQADVDAPTWFMRILAMNSVHLRVTGQATRRNLNVLMVIDRSKSLLDSGSCPALAADSKLFVQSFSNNRDRMGLVTFGTYYNVDFAPAFDFQTTLSNKLNNLACSGFTNAAAAFWTGYQQLKGLGDLNALNVILFFTDGQPNTVTFGPVPSLNGSPVGTGAALPKATSGTSCNATSGPFTGVVAGDVGYSVGGGIFKATNGTYPAPAWPGDLFLIDSSLGNNGGCAFAGNQVSGSPGFFTDVAYLPSTDAFGNGTDTSVLGGAGFPAATQHFASGVNIGKIKPNNLQTLENVGINALDNAAQRARVDAAAGNMPYIVYTIGLGNSGGVNDELLKRIANDAGALAHQTTYATGLYIYTPDTAHLSAAFATIASDVLRISK